MTEAGMDVDTTLLNMIVLVFAGTVVASGLRTTCATPRAVPLPRSAP